MLERYYVKPTTVDRIRSSWLSEPIDRYVGWLADKKYSVSSISRRIPLLVAFGEFARAHGADSVEALSRHIDAFIDSRMAERSYRRKAANLRKQIGKEVRGPIEQMLECVIPGFEGGGRARVPENAFESTASGFFIYLRQERGLREASIRGYSHYLRRFISYLDSIECRDLGHLSPPILSGFFLEYSKAVRWASVRDTCGILHVFCRYLYRERILARDFSRAIERPHRYRHSNIPRSITWDEVRQMLDGVDRRAPLGKRDYAILLLLVTYGLRGREVAALTLDDIDWRNERLSPAVGTRFRTARPISARGAKRD
jgi:site-specific recombinase XerD